jgi:hypothetical protein
MNAKMHTQQENMKAAIHSIRSDSEKTIKHRVKGVLSCVDQKTQGLGKELVENIDETQVDLHKSKGVHRYV